MSVLAPLNYRQSPTEVKLKIPAKLFIVLLAVAASGCARLNYYATAEQPVTTSDLPPGYEFKQHISESKRQIYLLWGLIPFRVVEQHEVFTPYLKTADGLANVQSKQEWDLLSWLISGFSYGFIQTLHTEFEADLITKVR